MQWQRFVFYGRDQHDFRRPLPRILNDSTHAVEVNCVLLSKGQYFSIDQSQLVALRSDGLGPFAKLRKRLIASSCLSVRPHGTARLPREGFSWNLIFESISKICRENSSFIKYWPEYRVLYIKTNIRITGTLHEDRYKNNGYFTIRPIQE